MTQKEADKLKRLITDYRNAAIADSWKGGGDPADFPEIEKRLLDARKALNAFIMSLIKK